MSLIDVDDDGSGADSAFEGLRLGLGPFEPDLMEFLMVSISLSSASNLLKSFLLVLFSYLLSHVASENQSGFGMRFHRSNFH